MKVKILIFNIAFFVLTSVICSAQTGKVQLINNDDAVKYARTILVKDLKKHLYIFASDEMEGRMTGERGQKRAAEYLKNFYIEQNISYEPRLGKYYQKFTIDRNNKELKTENVIAYIEGTDKKNEVIVISAHYDHLGMEDDKIFNGADDDGSGNVGMLEIAEAFQKATQEGKRPRRSILFLHCTAEEIGLYGSKYYTDNPVVPIKNTVTNLNIDMVGRINKEHQDNPNYIYLIGADKLSQDLHNISEMINQKYSNLELDYTYNREDDPNRFYYRSDHYNFAKKGVPVIFYFNGVHEDYHRHTDTVEKINYPLLEKRIRLIFYTAWELANREDRIRLNSKKTQ